MKFILSFLLVFAIHLNLHSQVSETDSLALVDIYNSLDGDNWDNNEYWLNGPVGDWYGIRLQGDRVVRITLSYNGLTGIVPESINDMDALEELFIGGNEISAPLPAMDNMTSLKTLYLYDVNLDSDFPELVRSVKTLVNLNLGKTGLIGRLPSWLPELSELRILELTSNELEGDFMAVLRNMPQLRTIGLFGNNFSGPLPDFSIFPHLEELTVGRNEFTGTFPEWVTELPSLRYLHLGYCNLNGELPDNLFSRMSQDLQQFVISDNNFEGDINSALDAYMPDLYRFEIDNNNFSGYLPEGVFDINLINRWSISNNNLSGIPDFMSEELEMAWFYNGSNKLGFEYLEPCLNIMTPRPSRRILGPQKPLMNQQHIMPNIGEFIMIYSGSEGQLSHYQWFRDSMPIPGATEAKYIIESYEPSDDGKYYCVISNDSFEFDLVRNPFIIGSLVGTKDRRSHQTLNVYPNPGNGTYMMDSDRKFDLLLVYDLKGRLVKKMGTPSKTLDLTDLKSGTYMIQAEGPDGRATAVIILE